MNNYDTLHLTGALEQSKSRQQINADLKQLEKIIRLLYLTGTFARGNTKKELNASIQSLQSQLNHVKLAAEIDGRNIKKEIDRALSGMSFKEIDALDIDADKAKLKIRKVSVRVGSQRRRICRHIHRKQAEKSVWVYPENRRRVRRDIVNGKQFRQSAEDIAHKRYDLNANQ